MSQSKRYAVKEIFGPTLQGEGSQAGRPVFFLRLAGCNRWSGLEKDRAASICSFCDTNFRGGERLSAEEILTKLSNLESSVKDIVISGGEPALQLDEYLLSTLHHQGKYNLHLETNGSIDLSDLADFFTHITMSPKQSRGETTLKFCHDVKILYPFISPDITADQFSDFPADNFFIQPIADGLDLNQSNIQEAVEFLYDHPKWRLSLQSHKILGID